MWIELFTAIINFLHPPLEVGGFWRSSHVLGMAQNSDVLPQGSVVEVAFTIYFKMIRIIMQSPPNTTTCTPKVLTHSNIYVVQHRCLFPNNK